VKQEGRVLLLPYQTVPDVTMAVKLLLLLTSSTQSDSWRNTSRVEHNLVGS
jgi:hypothetical protein